MALSDAALRSMLGKEYEKVQVKTDRDGLSARISCKGRITFQYRYRWNGQGERVDIGTYPATSLKEARDEAVRMRGELEQNRNPRLLKRMARHEAYSALTVEDVIRAWLEKYGVENKSDYQQVLRSFELHLFPQIGIVPDDNAPINMWLNVLEPLARKVPFITVRLLSNAKQAHNWAVRRQLIKTTPLSDLRIADLGVTLTQCDRVLSSDEIVTIFRAMEASRLAPKFKLLVQLCLLYGCRGGELSYAEKAHFDFEKKLWSIPPTHHKTGKRTRKPLVRPIIPAAEEMLKELFDHSAHSHYAIAKNRRDVPQGRSTLADIPQLIINAARRHLGIEMEHWTLHDLRRTARTNFSDLTEPHIAEIMLGHKLPGVWQVYDRHSYIEEQRRAYSLWWARVTAWAYGEGKVSVLALSS
ncbi:site-specific integrase [Pantoea agglomerans]|uniref:tyrosine-type recombinase/integrase n=1 Tax=Enterobacter agglomerans TaxID=549 RepID=UPI003C7C1371